MIIADEIDMYPSDYVQSILLPILSGQEKTILIAMTTRNPQEGKSWIDTLTNYKKDGARIVDSYEIKRVCDECLKKGEDYIMKCTHINLNIKMRSSDKENMIKDYMVSTGGSDSVRTEILGISKSSNNSAFDPKQVKIFVSSFISLTQYDYNHFDKDEKPTGFDNIIVTVDPNGGGKNRSAICVGAYHLSMGIYVVLFLKSLACESLNDFNSLFEDTLIEFNKLYPQLSRRIKHIFVESNGNFGADQLSSHNDSLGVAKKAMIGKMVFAGNEKKYGIYKNKNNSIEYIRKTRFLLSKERIKISENFASTLHGKKMISEIEKQLLAFQLSKTMDYQSQKRRGVIFDDELITIMMLPYWYEESTLDYEKLFRKFNSSYS